MYILTRYVVWEVLKLFLAALIALTLVVTMAMAMKEALNLGLPPGVALRTMVVMLPEMLGITIPVSMLFAVVSVFGRMTGTNELVAIKSLGISPMAVIWPVLVLACFLSLGTVWMYEIAARWSKPQVRRIVRDSVEEIAYGALRTNPSYSGPGFSIVVRCIDGRTLVGPTIMIDQPGQPKITLRAETATLTTDREARRLNIDCTNVEFDYGGPGGLYQGTFHYSVPLPSFEPDRFHRDWVAMRDIYDRIAEIESNIRPKQQLRDAKRALGTPTDAEDNEIGGLQYLIDRLRAEPYRRWANGFTCLCFALVGTPVAMFWRHAEVLTNFFVCFLPILAIYYPLLQFCDKLATSGTQPPVVFWMGNALMFVVAFVLLRRVVKH